MMGLRLQQIALLVLISLSVGMSAKSAGSKASKASKPNIVLIMADDLGYGDLGCFGNTTVRTPHLDQLAAQGVKLTHSVAAATMCTPSRAAFMTGRYSIRSGMKSPHFFRVLGFVASLGGLPTSEVTIGEVAKKAGYRTAFLGKWHLGWSTDRSDPEHRHPLNHGFDYFYGLPLTNIQDFDDLHRPILLTVYPNGHIKVVLAFFTVLVSTVCLMGMRYLRPRTAFLIISVFGLICGYFLFIVYNLKLLDSIIFRNYDIAEQPIHLPSVTRKLVKESQEFLQARHTDRAPFLLVLSWVHMHTALDTAPEFKGRSQHGPYGDALEEMDWGTGQLMDTLERLGMADNTLVYFTSDQGGDEKTRDWKGRVTGGFNGPFKGGKGDGSAEGAYRVPTLIKWPGHFQAGQVLQEPVSLMDVLPTVAQVLDVPPHSDVSGGQELDGRSLVPLLTGRETVSPHEFLFHYCQQEVHAVTHRPRSGRKIWKLVFREPDPQIQFFFDKCDGAITLATPNLYEMFSDPTATTPLKASDHPEVVSTIMKALEAHKNSVQDVPCQFVWWRRMWLPWKQPCCDFPRCACEDVKFRGLFED